MDNEFLAVKWTEQSQAFARPIRRLRLTDAASIQSQLWSSATRPPIDYKIAIELTAADYRTEHESLMLLLDYTHEAARALERLLGVKP